MQAKPTFQATALAVTASILALLSGVYQVWRGVKLANEAATYSEMFDGFQHYTMSFEYFCAWLRLETGMSGVATVILLIGAICVLARVSVGRWLVVAGGAVIIQHTIIGWAATIEMHHWFVLVGAGDDGQILLEAPNVPVIVLLSFVSPVVNAILVWLPATRSWWRVAGTRHWWRVSSIKQVFAALLARMREGLRPPLGTAECSPAGDPANLTNPIR